jgi:hypothetical protein
MKLPASILMLFTVSLTVPLNPEQATPKTATKDTPFVNSLGMMFVPVEITGGPTDASGDLKVG